MWKDTFFNCWRPEETVHVLPCPICEDDNIAVFANLVSCFSCGFDGPDHSVNEDGTIDPECLCDSRWAILDWNDLPRSPLQKLRYPNELHYNNKQENYFK